MGHLMMVERSGKRRYFKGWPALGREDEAVLYVLARNADAGWNAYKLVRFEEGGPPRGTEIRRADTRLARDD